jgi:hypothetical protein
MIIGSSRSERCMQLGTGKCLATTQVRESSLAGVLI